MGAKRNSLSFPVVGQSDSHNPQSVLTSASPESWGACKLSRLRRGLKVEGGFAAVGFTVPWLFLAYYTTAHRMGQQPSTTPLIYMCPSSIMG